MAIKRRLVEEKSAQDLIDDAIKEGPLSNLKSNLETFKRLSRTNYKRAQLLESALRSGLLLVERAFSPHSEVTREEADIWIKKAKQYLGSDTDGVL